MLAKSRGALVAVQARDFERAVAFYRDVLGLPMVFRHANQWAEFKAPGLVVGIGPAGDDAVVGGGTTAICFEVAAIDAVVEHLRRRGISFAGSVQEMHHGREAYFADSEGNPLTLHQSLSARPEAAAPREARRAKGGAAKKAAKRPSKGKAAPKQAKGAKRASGAKVAKAKPASRKAKKGRR
jgi:predicted enzyme related to lactoylglutathione lyase